MLLVHSVEREREGGREGGRERACGNAESWVKRHNQSHWFFQAEEMYFNISKHDIRRLIARVTHIVIVESYIQDLVSQEL